MARMLFLDDAHIDTLRGVTRRAHAAVRHAGNPVLSPAFPWEAARLQLYGGCIIFNPERRRYGMYYIAQAGHDYSARIRVNGRELPAHTTLPAYAESEDGVHWERPPLGQRTFQDLEDTNLLDFPRGMSFEGGPLYDPHDPDPARRFKMFYWDQRAQLLPKGTLDYQSWGYDCVVRVLDDAGQVLAEEPYNDWGIDVAFSPDGLRWTRQPGPAFRCYSDTGNSALYDPQLGKYVAFGRFNLTQRPDGSHFMIGRGIARVESDDFLYWSTPELVLCADRHDPPGFQINSMPVCLYEGLYLGLVEDFGKLEGHTPALQLAVSRDGRQWTRVAERAAMVEPAAEGAWDQQSPTGGSIRPAGSVFVHGDETRLYYCAAHPGETLRVGLAAWRRDGFVSLSADAAGGEVWTRPFLVEGPELHLNVAIRGCLRVEVYDRQGLPLPDGPVSAELHGDGTDLTVPWVSGHLAAWRGQPVTLRVALWDADWYGVWTA